MPHHHELRLEKEDPTVNIVLANGVQSARLPIDNVNFFVEGISLHGAPCMYRIFWHFACPFNLVFRSWLQ